MPLPLYPQERAPWYPFYRRLGGPQSWSARYGEVKIFLPKRDSNSIFWVRYSVLPFLADESSLLYSWLHAEHWTLELSLLCLYLCLHLSVSSVSHPLKRVLPRLNRGHLIEGLSLSVFTKRTPPLCRKHLYTLLWE
jgi:hypothetical protein